VGRIAAIVNHQHNKYHQDKTGFFGFLEAQSDKLVFEKLLNTSKDWLREYDRDKMVGPVNPSTNDEIGFLIDGFDSPPFFMMPHNPPYYKEMMETLGYEKAKDLYAYYLHRKNLVINKMFQRASEAVLKKYPITLRRINLKKLNEELEVLRGIYSDAWSKNWGFVPLTNEEFEFIADDFKQIVDPELVLLAEYNDEPVGFCVVLPNYNEVLIKIRTGKLLPLNWFIFLLNRKKIKGMRAILFGIKKKYQHLGLGSVFYMEIIRRALKRGYDNVEISWVLEDNQTINRILRLAGSKVYKTYRIYEAWL